MTKILAYDSMYMLSPLRKVYMALINQILNRKKVKSSQLILYRLDHDNILLRDKRNVSGMEIGVHKDKIDATSIKFYQYLE